KIAAPTWVNAGLSGAASLHGVLAFGGSELGHLLAIACDFEQRDSFAVVRPLTRNNAFEGERVPRNLRGIAGLQREDRLGTPRRGGHDADDHDAESGMGERSAIGGARQIAQPAPRL